MYLSKDKVDYSTIKSKLLNKYTTGRNFARKEIYEFELFKNYLIQKALLKDIHELITRNFRNFFPLHRDNVFNKSTCSCRTNK